MDRARFLARGDGRSKFANTRQERCVEVTLVMLSGEDGIEVIAWIRGVTGGGLPDPVDRFVSATGELKII